jgi:N-glycosylase/DNA lyase
MIYVASPYFDKNKKVMQERYEAVCAYCAKLALAKIYIYSPIIHWHPIAVSYQLPKDEKWWREYNEHFIALSEELRVVCLSGWEKSAGITREIKFAKERKIEVNYFLIGGTECTI